MGGPEDSEDQARGNISARAERRSPSEGGRGRYNGLRPEDDRMKGPVRCCE